MRDSASKFQLDRSPISKSLAMTPAKVSPVVLFFLFFVFLVPMSSHARVPSPAKGGNPSPFGFIKGLQGCHKGDHVKGIHKLKKYLAEFGYLSHTHSKNHTHDGDDFDELLESALKTYQNNYHLKVTGELDTETVSEMMKTRCGVADIINGTNWMQRGKKKHHGHHDHGSLHTVSHYSFFPGSPRWPPSKTHLTFAFLPNTPTRARSPVAEAFAEWAAATHFQFTQTQDHTTADMTIAFHRRNHGDGAPFDGPGGTIAHAFAPTRGWFHYDADEQYAVGAVQGAFDLKTVAIHEIGHLLGLGHSQVPEAIMYPSISQGVTKGLYQDDIQGINALYGRA